MRNYRSCLQERGGQGRLLAFSALFCRLSGEKYVLIKEPYHKVHPWTGTEIKLNKNFDPGMSYLWKAWLVSLISLGAEDLHWISPPAPRLQHNPCSGDLGGIQLSNVCYVPMRSTWALFIDQSHLGGGIFTEEAKRHALDTKFFSPPLSRQIYIPAAIMNKI